MPRAVNAAAARPEPPMSPEIAAPDRLGLFHPVIASWFRERVGTPTDVQVKAWPEIAAGRHVLITAPTGSGKTLTAFLWALDRLLTGVWEPGGVRVLYVSPLKALNNDIRRNLLTPLEDLQHAFAGHYARRANRTGEPVVAPEIRVATRSGDTTPAERRRMLRQPPEILVTTPESLNILLTSKGGRSILGRIESVILDEIHAVAGSKRGTHLITAVDRLVRLGGEFQRIGLSATVRPMERVARFLGGWEVVPQGEAEPRYRPRPVALVHGGDEKRYDLKVVFPLEEERSEDGRLATPAEKLSEKASEELPADVLPDVLPENFWENLTAAFRERIRANRSTLLFANSRRLTEKITRFLNEGETAELAYSHHGSLSREIRQVVEERLKDGRLAAIVATSSLELGIDIGALDEVLLIQTPPTLAAAVQRIGRAGHQVGEVSRARLYPTYGRDFLDAAVMARSVLDGEIEEVHPVAGALDVLAQVLLSMTVAETWDVEDLYRFLRSTWPYRDLTRRQYELVLEMLAGRYADTRLRELKPRIRLDRVDGTVRARPGTDRLLYMSGGTIPDRGYYHLRLEGSSARIGELDEEFVWERSVGDTFTLGAQAWRIRQITHNDVFVTPARKGASLAPFWRAEARDRSHYLSSKVAELLERAEAFLSAEKADALEKVLTTEHAMEPQAAEQTVSLLVRQRSVTGAALPGRRHLVVERVEGRRSDRLDPQTAGEREVILHNFWGGKVNRPFALALTAAWEERHGVPLPVIHDDDCLILHLPPGLLRGPGELVAEVLSLVPPHRVEELLRKRLEATGFFGARFREAAGRALLLPRAGFDRRVPLWLNRLRSKKLLGAVRRHDDFPLLLETWRTCLRDEFELEPLRELLTRLDAGEIRVTEVTTDRPSPFAASLVWKQTNRLMYEDDTPEGAAGPGLSRDLLQELVFSSRLRPRLPGELIDRFQRKLHRTWPEYAPRTPGDLLEWVQERLLIPLTEWRELLAAAERDATNEGEPLDLDALLEPLAGKVVKATLPGGSEAVAAVDRLPRIFEGLGLDPESVALTALRGDGEDAAARGALTDLLERGTRPEFEESEEREVDGHDPDDDPLPDLLGEWLRFYGPVRRELPAETFGLSEDRLRDALETLIEEERIVLDDFRRRDGEEETPSDEHLEICDAENLEILLRLLRAESRPSFEARPITHLPLFLATHQGLAREEALDLQDLREVLERLFGYPAPAAAWEEYLLPARLSPYYTSWLDTLMQESELVWLGTGPERLTFAFASDLELFAQEGEDGEEGDGETGDGEGSGVREELDALFPSARGKLSFDDLLEHTGLDAADLTEDLWRQAWAGRVTNSTFLAVRRGILSRFRPPAPPRRRAPAGALLSRSRRWATDRWRSAQVLSGDWYRLDGANGAGAARDELDALDREELNKDRVRQLLHRYGVLFRELLGRELPALRWGPLFRTLRLMELSGEVVAGHFFEGIPGLQFCSPSALRRLRVGLIQDRVFWINAIDPASPCGLGLEALKGEVPPRLPSTHLVFHGSRRVVTSRRNGSELEIAVEPKDPDLPLYLEFLKVLLGRDFNPWHGIEIEAINGEDAAKSPYAPVFAKHFQATRDHRTIRLRRRY